MSAAIRITDDALPHHHVCAYLTRCTDRPGWKGTVDAYRERVEAA